MAELSDKFVTRYNEFTAFLDKWESDPSSYDESSAEYADDIFETFETADWNDLEGDWKNHSKNWQLPLIDFLSISNANARRILTDIMLSPDDEISAKAAANVAWYLRRERLEHLPEIYQRLSQTVLKCSGEQKELITELLKSLKGFI